MWTRSAIDYSTNDLENSTPTRASSRRGEFLFIPLALSMHIYTIGSRLQALALVSLPSETFNGHCSYVGHSRAINKRALSGTAEARHSNNLSRVLGQPVKRHLEVHGMNCSFDPFDFY